VTRRELDDLGPLQEEYGIAGDNQGPGALAHHRGESVLDLVGRAGDFGWTPRVAQMHF
jgi:hypothetical protein